MRTGGTELRIGASAWVRLISARATGFGLRGSGESIELRFWVEVIESSCFLVPHQGIGPLPGALHLTFHPSPDVPEPRRYQAFSLD